MVIKKFRPEIENNNKGNKIKKIKNILLFSKVNLYE